MISDEVILEDGFSGLKSILTNTGFALNDTGELCRIENELYKPLSNFIFWPVKIIKRVSESGMLEIHKYVFEGILNGKQKLQRVEVPVSDLKNAKWVKDWDIFCEVYPKEKQSYSLILKYLSQFEKKDIIQIEYDSIGWHYFDNQWFYLHSGGAFGASKYNIRTTKKDFNLKIDTKLSDKESFLKSLDLLEICDSKLTYSLLSYVLTSLVATPLLQSKVLSPNYLLWIVGKTGFGKSTFSTFFTNIYEKENLARPDAHKTKVLEPNLEDHKDCVFIIDDFGTFKTKSSEYSVTYKVEDIIRRFTDRHLTSNNKFNGMVLITGEKFLDANQRNDSSTKRIIRVRMDNLFNREDDSYDESRAIKFHNFEEKRHLPTSISYYLEWLSARINLSFIEDYKKDFETLRKEIGEKYTVNGRYTDSFVHQIIAFNFYLSYGKQQGFITPEEYINKCNHAKEVFSQLLLDQFKTIFDPNVELFLSALTELINEEKIFINFDEDRLDFDNSVYGTLNTKNESEELLLDWENVYKFVSSHVMQKNTKKIPTVKSLGKLLKQYEIIDEAQTTSPFRAKRGSTERCRVIKLKGNMVPELITAIKLKKEERDKLNPLKEFLILSEKLIVKK